MSEKTKEKTVLQIPEMMIIFQFIRKTAMTVKQIIRTLMAAEIMEIPILIIITLMIIQVIRLITAITIQIHPIMVTMEMMK